MGSLVGTWGLLMRRGNPVNGSAFHYAVPSNVYVHVVSDSSSKLINVLCRGRSLRTIDSDVEMVVVLDVMVTSTYFQIYTLNIELIL